MDKHASCHTNARFDVHAHTQTTHTQRLDLMAPEQMTHK